jgi:hypothetical protein
MVGGAGDIRPEHAEEVERHAERSPTVVLAEAPHEEYHTEDHTQGNAAGMTPRVPQFLAVAVKDVVFECSYFLEMTIWFVRYCFLCSMDSGFGIWGHPTDDVCKPTKKYCNSVGFGKH